MKTITITGFKLKKFPKKFPNKGLYRTWTSSWMPNGYSSKRQYPGQMRIKFPEDAAPIECVLGGYIVPDTN